MLNYVAPGRYLNIPAAPVALASGQGCLVGSIFGIATGPALQGAPVVLLVEGVVTLPKVSALAMNVGDAAYWDNTQFLVDETEAGNTRIGVVVTTEPNPSGTVNVRLNGNF